MDNEKKESTLVVKFGGASMKSLDQFRKIAAIVVDRKKKFSRVVVVVSAMYKVTDFLLDLAKKVSQNPPKREQDMLLTVGERVSMALLAMVFSDMGFDALSFTGSQAGIVTSCDHSDARIIDVRPRRLLEPLAANKIIIVAGFQGVSEKGEITTLGRGGSDTTAVALGVALKAEKVEFYKDVKGIFERDPRLNPKALHLPILKYSEALSIISREEHEVLHHRAVLLAEKNCLPLYVRSYEDAEDETGSIIVSDDCYRQDMCLYEGLQEQAVQ